MVQTITSTRPMFFAMLIEDNYDSRTPRAKQIMQRTLDISRDNDAFHVVFDGVETVDLG